MADSVNPDTADRLRGYFEALVELDERRQEIAGFMKEIRDQAKEAGFDSGILTKMVARHRKLPIELITIDGILETYEAALGVNAQAAGMLSTRRAADGSFEVAQIPSAASPAAKKLSRKQEQLRDQMALAGASQMARNS